MSWLYAYPFLRQDFQAAALEQEEEGPLRIPGRRTKDRGLPGGEAVQEEEEGEPQPCSQEEGQQSAAGETTGRGPRKEEEAN